MKQHYTQQPTMLLDPMLNKLRQNNAPRPYTV